MTPLSTTVRPLRTLCLAGLLAMAALGASASDGHSSRDTLDWEGTYAGTLPCNGCKGLTTHLTLRGNGTYRQTTAGKGHEARRTESGRFTWDKAGRRIRLARKGQAPSAYFVAEGYLEPLGKNGRPVAQAHRLEKQD